MIGKYRTRISEIDSLFISKKKGKAISLILILVVISTSLLLNQANITGNVVFSMSETKVDIVNWEFSESDTKNWTPKLDGRLNTIAVSGKYIGNDSVRIYLILPQGDKLIYATETSSEFISECGNACYLHDNSRDSYEFRVEIESGTIAIESVDYMISALEEFKITPKNVSMQLNSTRYIKNKFQITNPKFHTTLKH